MIDTLTRMTLVRNYTPLAMDGTVNVSFQESMTVSFTPVTAYMHYSC